MTLGDDFLLVLHFTSEDFLYSLLEIHICIRLRTFLISHHELEISFKNQQLLSTEELSALNTEQIFLGPTSLYMG